MRSNILCIYIYLRLINTNDLQELIKERTKEIMRIESVAEPHTGFKIVNMEVPLEEDQSMEVAWKAFVQIQMIPPCSVPIS
jgi:hypothetical protein